MFFGSEGQLFELASAICSVDGDDAPMGGGSPDVGGDDGGGQDGAPAGDEMAGEDGEAVQQDVDPAATTVVPDPAAAVEQAPVEEQLDPAVVAEMQRLMGGMQPQQQAAPAPDYLAQLRPLLEPIVQQNQMLMQQQQQAQQAAFQARVEATRPQPPPPDAPAAAHLKFINDNLAWEQKQGMSALEQKIDAMQRGFQQQQQQAQQAWQAQQVAMQQSQRDAAYAAGIKQISSDPRAPHMKVFADPDLAAVVQSLHERIVERGGNMGMGQLAQLLAQKMGIAPKTAATNAAARRGQETAALKSQREAARQGGRPLPAAVGNGKAGAPPKGARESALKAIQNGARLDPALLRSLNINPTQH